MCSSADPRISTDRGYHGLGPGHRHHQGKFPYLQLGFLSGLLWVQREGNLNLNRQISQPGNNTESIFVLPARLPPLPSGVLHPRLGGWPHLERDQAAVGRGAEGVRQRPLERGGLHHQLPLRGHHRSESPGFLWRKLSIPSCSKDIWPEASADWTLSEDLNHKTQQSNLTLFVLTISQSHNLLIKPKWSS